MPGLGFYINLITYKVLFPGKPNGWTADHLPDLSTKVFLVTGGNVGIGRETVKQLLLKNAKVYMASRSQEKSERTIEELREETGKTALFLKLDLGDLDAVKKAAEEFEQRESQLDSLILNAGVLHPPPDQQVTAQGYETTFGANVIGHFLLVRLLYPMLSAAGSEADTSRIVWLSSMAHHASHRFVYEAFRDGPVCKKMDPFELYAESKLAAILLSNHLARSCAKDNVTSIAVDPGCIKSTLYRSSPWHLRAFDWLYWYPVEYGALGSLFAGAAPEAAQHNGKYLQPWARLAPPNTLALDEGEQDKLWAWLEEQIKPYL
ncbi:NAD-P-binding protein [Lenzites betulinus]|nr:NAD-P-binding protein [Lenzites betulinus]